MSIAPETNRDVRRSYLPVAGRDIVLPLYDPLVTLLGGDVTRTTLMDQAAPEPGHCGRSAPTPTPGDIVVRQRSIVAAVIAILLLGLTGCATAFGPKVVRDEIALQTGEDPGGVFALPIGRRTMMRVRTADPGAPHGGTLPLAGAAEFQLAVYDVRVGSGEVDFARMPIRGWTQAVKFREGPNSALVLVRAQGRFLGDLVLLAGGANQVFYARIKGQLSKDLPEALNRTLRKEGPQAVQKEFMAIAEPSR